MKRHRFVSPFIRQKYIKLTVFVGSFSTLVCLGYLWTGGKLIYILDKVVSQQVNRHFVDDRLVNLFRNGSKAVQLIVLWTNWFSDPNWNEFWDVGDRLIDVGDNGRKCYLTTSRRYVPKASAVVFHGRDFRFSDLPLVRRDWQRWVFFLLESPVYSHFEARHWLAADMVGFNWSMSYRPNADIYAPYVYIDKRTYTEEHAHAPVVANRIEQFSRNFINKEKVAVWLSSNCETSGHREQLVQTLVMLGVDIDIFGGCSDDQQKPPADDESFFEKYRFYLAFENSFCDDYATEKVARAMHLSQRYGVIPVVYGGAQYERLLPEGSYIDAQAFDSVEAFATRLIDLSTARTVEAIQPYFTWQYAHWLADDEGKSYLKKHLIRGMDSLCRKLWSADLRQCNIDATNMATTQNITENTRICKMEGAYSAVTKLKTTFGNCRL